MFHDFSEMVTFSYFDQIMMVTQKLNNIHRPCPKKTCHCETQPTFQSMNNKGADQTVQTHRLVCTFVAGLQQIQVFWGQGPLETVAKLIMASQNMKSKSVVRNGRFLVILACFAFVSFLLSIISDNCSIKA